jgi:hypothetical protein
MTKTRNNDSTKPGNTNGWAGSARSRKASRTCVIDVTKRSGWPRPTHGCLGKRCLSETLFLVIGSQPGGNFDLQRVEFRTGPAEAQRMSERLT